MNKDKVRITDDGEVVPLMTEDGAEIPDPVPMAPPVGFVRQEPLHLRIRAMVQAEYLRAKESEDVESPDEADDFDVDDETYEPHSPYEHNFDPPREVSDMHKRLVELGWTPPAKKEEAKPPRAPSGGEAVKVEEKGGDQKEQAPQS